MTYRSRHRDDRTIGTKASVQGPAPGTHADRDGPTDRATVAAPTPATTTATGSARLATAATAISAAGAHTGSLAATTSTNTTATAAPDPDAAIPAGVAAVTRTKTLIRGALRGEVRDDFRQIDDVGVLRAQVPQVGFMELGGAIRARSRRASSPEVAWRSSRPAPRRSPSST